MAKQAWMFCKRCHKDQIFMLVYKSHGIFGGHEDWHCSVCGDCAYESARNH